MINDFYILSAEYQEIDIRSSKSLFGLYFDEIFDYEEKTMICDKHYMGEYPLSKMYVSEEKTKCMTEMNLDIYSSIQR